MSTTLSKWLVPVLGFVIGILICAAELGHNATPLQGVVSFAIVAGYALAVRFLQARSEIASLFAGLPVDERWESINQRSLSNAAQVLAVALVIAFLGFSFAGRDAMPYAWLGALFALSYLGSIIWYRFRA